MAIERSRSPALELKHGALSEQIIGVFFEVYNEIGYGYLESVYENALVIALGEKGLSGQQQVPVPVSFCGRIVGTYTADIIVDGAIVLELKTARAIDDIHRAELMNYLRGTDIELGLLLNFGPKPEFKRMVLDNERKKSWLAKSN